MIGAGHTCHYSILYSVVMPLKLLDNEYIKTIQMNWLATVSFIPVLLWRKELLGTMREMRDLGDTLACKGPFTTVLIDYSACGNGVCWESSKLSFEYLFNIVESVSMEMSYLSKMSMPVMACYHSVLWHNASWQNNPQLPPIPILYGVVSLSSCILVTLTSVKLICLVWCWIQSLNEKTPYFGG